MGYSVVGNPSLYSRYYEVSSTAFEFGSDTNTQLFIEYLVGRDKRFEFDYDRVLVWVPLMYLDDDTLDRAHDLGGHPIETL